jgi:hypothetical protein
MATYATDIDGIVISDINGADLLQPMPAISAGYLLRFLGQTANTSGSNVANQQNGTVSIVGTPAGSPAVLTFAVSNTLLKTTSQIQLSLFERVAGAAATVTAVCVSAVGASSFTIKVYFNATTAIAANQLDCWYFILGS